MYPDPEPELPFDEDDYDALWASVEQGSISRDLECRRRTMDFPVSGGAFNDFDEYHFGSAAAPDRGHHQAAGDETMETRNVRVSWTTPGVTGRHSQRVAIPANARNVRCEVQLDVEEADDFDVVRVRFEPGGREYCYRMDLDDSIRVHDYVLAPPNSYSNKPQVVRVTGFGRNHYSGTIYSKVAKLPTGYEPR